MMGWLEVSRDRLLVSLLSIGAADNNIGVAFLR